MFYAGADHRRPVGQVESVPLRIRHTRFPTFKWNVSQHPKVSKGVGFSCVSRGISVLSVPSVNHVAFLFVVTDDDSASPQVHM